MAVEGTIHNGVVVLDEGMVLPEGTRVTIVATPTDDPELPTHLELFREAIGRAVDLPADYALSHGHYVRGEPKR